MGNSVIFPEELILRYYAMECVQVLDKSGKVVYVFESFGSAVHIGRDQKKCAIALPVDAQGVSRVHGSLAWSGQGELTFSDTSTYGTLVDGTLVKATNKAVNDKSHILVGDVELIISFVPQTSTNTSSSNSSTAFLKGSSAKRKSVLTDSLSNEKKRSKLEPPQSQKISSFFQKGSNTTEYDTLMVLAEDTPRSQSSKSRKGATQNLIFFVSDSVEDPPDGKSTLSNIKTDNQSAAKHELSFLATAVPRRKKQCIFDVNKRNVSRQSLSVIVEDTQLKPTTCNEFNSKKATAKSVNVTCVADTCEQTQVLVH
ncbi:hypothetical protein RB195_018308 [Necator americanus]|uniref:FHA domain-containing protein n=1 Tax=Necator americanus TaxID=51031 RepID=A0ABR1C946_NECAM